MTKAHKECIKLINILDSSQAMDFESHISERKEEFSTAYLFGDSRGKMLGILVCKNKEGKEIVLKAFSSQYNGLWNIPGWVPPVLDSKAFNKLVSPVDKVIKELDKLIKKDPKNSGHKKKRKALSVNLMSKIQDQYHFKDFFGNE